jgi:hypothetical protein
MKLTPFATSDLQGRSAPAEADLRFGQKLRAAEIVDMQRQQVQVAGEIRRFPYFPRDIA